MLYLAEIQRHFSLLFWEKVNVFKIKLNLGFDWVVGSFLADRGGLIVAAQD